MEFPSYLSHMRSRREFLRRTAAICVPLGLAGCTGASPATDGTTQTDTPTETPTDTTTDPPTDEVNVENPKPVSEAVFDAWEPDTNCNGGERESMYNSEISVKNVVDERPAGSNPIAYDGLPDAEKRILAEVLAVGGNATCDTSAAFQSFLEKAVYEYAAEQEGDDMNVWLEYEGAYYKLYLRKQDQVFAY